MATTRRRRKTAHKGTAAARCKNLYRLIRLRLGDEVSDREIARRWGMEWRSFAALKQGTRQVPRLDELERLGEVLGGDAWFVIQAARGVEAEEVAAGMAREGRLRAIVERVRDGVFTIDPQGRIQDANPGLAEMVGIEPRDLVGRSLLDLVAPESTAPILGALATIARDGRVSEVELCLRRSDGSTRVVLLEAARIADPEGRPLGAQGLARDVTLERQLAGELERQRRMLQTVFDSVPAACILFEADLRIVAANPLVEHVCATSAAEMVGRLASEVFGDHAGPEGCPVVRALRSGRVEQQVSFVENRQGQRVYVHRTAGPVIVGGRVDRVIEILVDVTEQIQRGDLRVLQLWQGQTPESLGDPNRERRTMPRAAVSFSASLRWRDRVLDGIVENLGAEGLFVLVEDPPEVGTEGEIEWELPADFAPVSVRARVMWRRPSGRRQPAGMGLRFQQIAPVRLRADVLAAVSGS